MAHSSEAFRPQFHFTAQRNWINDPNGLIHFDGEYHLFFQYNPHGSQWGHMSWGHAVSTDLLHWEELPVAIPEDERAMVFSGSVVYDRHNSSGLGTDAQPPLVACYTACLQAPGVGQVQDLAYSTDRGRTWQRYAHNPVLDVGLRDFRDPKVFWHAPTARWIMVVVVPDDREARFYASTNLRDWQELSRFSAPFEGQGIWECPDLMELPVEGGGTVWMLKVDAFGGHPSGETGARLFFGHFDGTRFLAEPEVAPQWVDGGSDFYAALSWADLPAEPWQGKPVWLAWMSCHRYAKHLPTDHFRGAMTLPRQLHARRAAQAWSLVQQPLPNMVQLRGPVTAHPTRAVAAAAQRVLWSQQGEGPCVELQWELRSLPENGVAVLELRGQAIAGADQPHRIQVGYDARRGELFIDRSQSGCIPNGDARYAGRRAMACPAPSAEQPLRLQLWWDWSSVEVLAAGGAVALTEQAFPSGQRWSVVETLLGQDEPEAADTPAESGPAALCGPAQVWPLRPTR